MNFESTDESRRFLWLALRSVTGKKMQVLKLKTDIKVILLDL